MWVRGGDYGPFPEREIPDLARGEVRNNLLEPTLWKFPLVSLVLRLTGN